MLKIIEFILLILAIYYGLGFLGRYVLPLLLGHYISKKFSQMQNDQQEWTNKNQRKPEVTIDNQPAGKKKYPKDAGDYVDFEEVK